MKILANCVAWKTNATGANNITINDPVEGRVTPTDRFSYGDPVRYKVDDGEEWARFEGILTDGGAGLDYITRARLVESSTGSDLDLSNTNGKLCYVEAGAEMLAADGGRLNIATTTGSGTAYLLDLPIPLEQLKDGAEVWFVVHTPNTDPGAGNYHTLKVNATEAKPIKAGIPRRRIAFGALTTDALVGCKYSEAGACWVPIAGLVRTVKTIAGAEYSVVEEDDGQVLVFTNAGGCAMTLAEATGQFAPPFGFEFEALGGALTITPTTSTINGAASAKVGGRNVVVADGGNYRVSLIGREAIMVLLTSESGVVAAGTGKSSLPMPYAFAVTEVGAYLKTAQASGSIFTLDINKNGTSILSTKLTIDNTESTSEAAATPAVISTTTLAKGDVVSWDVDQVGDGTAAGCKSWVVGYQLP
jgi:hypothetical protein